METGKIGGFLTGMLQDEKKRTNLILVLAGAAALLILLSGVSCSEQESGQTAAEPTAADYVSQLEARLEDIISSVEGAGKTKVMITLQNTAEYVYVCEDSTRTDSSESVDSSGRKSSDASEDRQSSYIIIDTDRGEQALVRTELMPSVSGVVVVCSGASLPGVAEKITAVVTTALDISSKRVCITQLSE